MQIIDINENGIYIQWRIEDNGDLKLIHFSSKPLNEKDIVKEAVPEGFPFIGMNLSGFDRPYERHGNKYIVTAPGYRMKYISHEDRRNETGRQLLFCTRDEETHVYVKSFLQFYDGLPVVRIWHRVENHGNDVQTLEYISSFHYEGIEKEGVLHRDEKMKIWIPHNSWQRELNWKCHTLPELGLEQVQPDEIQRSSGMLRISNTGNWSTKEYLPMAFLQNTETGTGLFWQIEHNGSWHWEIGDQNGHLYLALGGPNETYSHWFKNLKPGESFETVKAAVGVSSGTANNAMDKPDNDTGRMDHATDRMSNTMDSMNNTTDVLNDVMGTLTEYRRRIRRKNRDNEMLPVIFNDYMNCLWGKPEAEKEYPLIRAAADAGCEYYCIDAGWYADGDWWDNVGEWKESALRFPEGLRKVTDYIRSFGMVPGVWLEPEVMGIHCDLASKVPDDWFFVRHGRRVYDRSRFQLDYRNPAVRRHMTEVVDRLIREYGVGYIKTDYNIEPGIGTELYTESCGEGMLEHERCYLAWLDNLWEKYPDLIIENCSSGGLRMDYAMLSRCSIQSTSDQDDYLKYAVIAANAPTGVTPEQAAVWTYPMNHEQPADAEELRRETVFNMVNAMLLRIHQSGHLAQLDDERKNLVKEGIRIYKTIRSDIPHMRPFWPLGLASYEDTWVCMGLYGTDKAYLAVWKRKDEPQEVEFPLTDLIGKFTTKGKEISVSCLYPSENHMKYAYDSRKQTMTAATRENIAAALFVIRCEQ